MVAKIAVIFYSTYGHVRTLAETIYEEIKAQGNVEVDLLQIPEILSEEVRGKLHAAPRGDYPDVTAEDLKKYDGFLLGAPTRYGRMPAAVSAFFDTTGGLWFTGALVGKFAGIFTSTASQHGGQESTALTTVPFFAHHGINFVPIAYTLPELTDNTEVVGGSAYGAAAVANGDGSRAVSEKEKTVAKFQAKHFSKIVKQFVAGASALEKLEAAGNTGSTAVVAAEPAPIAPTTAGVEGGEPVLGKALPAAEAEPYAVETPAAPKPKQETATPTATESTAVATPAAAEPAPAPAAVEEKPVTVAATPAAKKVEQPKKKKGIFSMCCGGNANNYDS
ncbi:hypothetical protein JCM8547_001749 [Rhodosporidiobolus lusitaniae]